MNTPSSAFILPATSSSNAGVVLPMPKNLVLSYTVYVLPSSNTFVICNFSPLISMCPFQISSAAFSTNPAGS